MSDTNRLTLYSKKQSAFGTQATGNYQTYRFAGESLATVTGATPSDEIESGRMVTDVAQTARHTEGPVRARFSYGAYDEWLAAALQADQADTWQAVQTDTLAAGKTLQAIAAGNILRTAGASKIVWANHGLGRWIRVKGFATNPATIWCRITAIAGDDATVDHVTLVDEAAIASGEVERGPYITNGVTERLYSHEIKYGDLSSNFVLWRDQTIAGMNFAVAADGLVDLGFNWMGAQEIFNTSTQAGTPVASTDKRIINGVSHIKAVMLDGSTFGMSKLSWQLSNAVRQRLELGSLGPVSFGYGRMTCEVDLEAYYANNTNLAKHLSFADVGLAFRVVDIDGNAYVIHWPAGNFTAGTRQGERTDDDVFQKLHFMSKKHNTWGYQMQIAKWDV